MKKNLLLIILIMIILAGAWILYMNSVPNKNSVSWPAISSLPTSTSPSLSLASSTLSAASSSKPISQVTYVCKNDKTIKAAFYEGKLIPVKPGESPIPTGSVKLVLSDGRNLDLPQTLSADGARYANTDESFVFWSKGDGSLVLENDAEKDYVGCVVPNKASNATSSGE
jgi:membrane-bound inhibitor of C-type lysozyme